MSVGNYNYMFKFIIVGDSYVGKSNLLIQYTQKKFRGEHEITIGCEFMAKNIIVNEKNIRIQVWDTAGQEAFRSITRSYYKNSACALLVYDISNRDSFSHIENWLIDCREMIPKSSILVLVGNKSDKEDMRQVTTPEAEEFARNNELLFMETSAMTGFNVDNLFSMAAKEVLGKIESGVYELNNEACGIKIGAYLGKGRYSKISNEASTRYEPTHKKKCCTGSK